MAWDTTPVLAAGTDLPTQAAAGDTHIAKNRIRMVNGRLLGCATGGAAGAAVNALGILNTNQAPAAGEVALPSWWGRGAGNWTTLDQDKINVIVTDGNVGDGYACATPDADLVSITFVAVAGGNGNLTFRFFNRGTAAAGPLSIILEYVHSENR